jgi:hypothetical protein
MVNHTRVQFHVHKQFASDNPFTFLGVSAIRGAKHRRLVNDEGEAINNKNVVVPIVHKGVPHPCQNAEEMRRKWVGEFERYYSREFPS